METSPDRLGASRRRTPSTRVLRSGAGGEGGDFEIHIEGPLDALTVDDIRPVLEAVLADHPRRVTVDLEKVHLLDSVGVSVIVSLWKRVKAQGGSVVVVRAHDQPLAVLTLLKLDAIFGIPPGNAAGRGREPA